MEQMFRNVGSNILMECNKKGKTYINNAKKN